KKTSFEMITIEIQSTVSYGRNEPALVETVIEYGHIVIIEINKERETQSKSTPALPGGNHFKFYLIRLFVRNFGDRFRKKKNSFAGRIQPGFFKITFLGMPLMRNSPFIYTSTVNESTCAL